MLDQQFGPVAADSTGLDKAPAYLIVPAANMSNPRTQHSVIFFLIIDGWLVCICLFHQQEYRSLT